MNRPRFRNRYLRILLFFAGVILRFIGWGHMKKAAHLDGFLIRSCVGKDCLTTTSTLFTMRCWLHRSAMVIVSITSPGVVAVAGSRKVMLITTSMPWTTWPKMV